MTNERYKQLMFDFGMPDSQSLYIMLKQVAIEIEQETNKRWKNKITNILKKLEGGLW